MSVLWYIPCKKSRSSGEKCIVLEQQLVQFRKNKHNMHKQALRAKHKITFLPDKLNEIKEKLKTNLSPGNLFLFVTYND